MITIERFGYTPHGTFGRLTFRDFYCYTLERPWEANRQSVSCIPEGVYSASRYNSPVRGEVWQLNNVPGRSYIQIHPANIMDELEGCIALGLGLGYLSQRWCITRSAPAVSEFMDLTEKEAELSINIIPFSVRYP